MAQDPRQMSLLRRHLSPFTQSSRLQPWPSSLVSQSGYSPSRNRTATGVVFHIGLIGPPFFTLHTAQVVVTYAPDVFGGTRREVESLTATSEFQRFQLEAAHLTLTSNVVDAAVQEASLRGQIAATEEVIRIETQSVGILRKQLELGQVAGGSGAEASGPLIR